MHPDYPYQQYLVAQFVRSFKNRGLKVGLYYCWRHPGFDKGKSQAKFKVLPPECDPAQHTLEEQKEFQKKQIAELIERYRDICYIWNDGLDPGIMSAEEAREFIEGIRRIRPNVIANSNWWDWGKKGMPFLDIAVKEVRHFPEANTVPGETCWPLDQGWFWTGNESRTKGVKTILEQIATAHSRGSNFLLNVGPDRGGKIVESNITALVEISAVPLTNTDHAITSIITKTYGRS